MLPPNLDSTVCLPSHDPRSPHRRTIAASENVEPLVVPVAKRKREAPVPSRGQVAEALLESHRRKQRDAAISQRIRVESMGVHAVVRMFEIAGTEAAPIDTRPARVRCGERGLGE
jgi:hypothetical protein